VVRDRLPTFGICLGHQILGSPAAGALQAEVRPRGANHPVKNLETGQVEITPQNHGFWSIPSSSRTPASC